MGSSFMAHFPTSISAQCFPGGRRAPAACTDPLQQWASPSTFSRAQNPPRCLPEQTETIKVSQGLCCNQTSLFTIAKQEIRCFTCTTNKAFIKTLTHNTQLSFYSSLTNPSMLLTKAEPGTGCFSIQKKATAALENNTQLQLHC